MRILLTEPKTARYIHIASEMNMVHLLVPIETKALKKFFDGCAVYELNTYKSALVLDILLLEESDLRRTAKKDRLIQIEDYIKAIIHMKDSYGHVIHTFQAKNPLAEARYVLHQNATCVNFANIIDPIAASNHPAYFERVRLDFACRPDTIPDRNESIASDFIDVATERLLREFNDEQLDRLLLSPADKEACKTHPAFKVRSFLDYVAKATPDKTDATLIKTEAEALLKATKPADRQALLRNPGVFTDYSGRTFNCTAFEYAYWAKDIHMCRMLVSHMDKETKAQILTRITANDTHGLSFQRNGTEYRSPHFDLTTLKTALQVYVDGFDTWRASRDSTAMDAAWLAIGKAQRELPVHFVNEYCRDDRSFDPTPQFNELTLPRTVIFFNYINKKDSSWFPLRDPNSGIGFDFSLLRGACDGGRGGMRGRVCYSLQDWVACTTLDERRSVELKHLLHELNSPKSTPFSCLVM